MNIPINADLLLKELRHELRKVETNIIDPLCDPKKKRSITLKITVDPHGDPHSMPLMSAEIGSTLAPRDCSGIAAVCEQMSLFNMNTPSEDQQPEVSADA
jgi:hypothetical protein